jgi:hypothetical protein
MKTAIFAFALLALPLAGCETMENAGPHSPKVAAADDAECLSYGAKPCSSEYITCRTQKSVQHEQTAAEVLAASSGGGGGGPTTCQTFSHTTTCY